MPHRKDVEEYGYKTAEELGSIVDYYSENPTENEDKLVSLIKGYIRGELINTARKYITNTVGVSVSNSINLGVIGDVYSGYCMVTAPLLEVMGAAMAGMGVGCVSYDLAPEFWTDLSNAVLGSLGVDPVEFDDISGLSMVVEVSRHPLTNELLFGMPYPVMDVLKTFMSSYGSGDATVSNVDIGTPSNPKIVSMLGGDLYKNTSKVLRIGNLTSGQILADWARYAAAAHNQYGILTDFQYEGLSMALADPDINTRLQDMVHDFETTSYFIKGDGNVVLDVQNFSMSYESHGYYDTIYVSYAYRDDFKLYDNWRVHYDSYYDISGGAYTYGYDPEDFNAVVHSTKFKNDDNRSVSGYVVSFYLDIYTPYGQSFYETTRRYGRPRIDMASTTTPSYLMFDALPSWRNAGRNYSTMAALGKPLPDSIIQAYTFDYTADLDDSIPNRIAEPVTDMQTPEGKEITRTVYIGMPKQTPTTGEEPNELPEGVPEDTVIMYPNGDYQIEPTITPPSVPYPPYTGGDYAPATADDDTDTGMYTVFNPTLNEVRSLSDFLWSDSFIDDIKKLFGNPIDAIISLHKLYATPLTSTVKEQIKCGYIPAVVDGNAVTAYTVTNQFTSIDCGIIDVEEIYGNVRDYLGYIQMNLYLPFIGIIGINPNEFMGKKMHVYYNIDVITGTCVAFISVRYQNGKEKIVSMHNGNCLVSMPITAGGHSNFVNALIGVGVGMLTGNAIGATTSALGSMSQEISRSGNISSNAGALSPKKPYLLITRKVPRDFVRNTHTAGYGENRAYGTLSDFVSELPEGDNVFSITDFYPRVTGEVSVMPEELTRLSQLLSNGVVYRK